GLDRRPAVVELYIARGGDEGIGIVVVDAVGLDQHLRIGVALARTDSARSGLPSRRDADPVLAEAGVGCLRRGRPQANGPDSRHRQQERYSFKPETAGQHPHRTSGGHDGHHPSSWYNNTTNPVSPPTNTGSQAAATGCISSALLMSS